MKQELKFKWLAEYYLYRISAYGFKVKISSSFLPASTRYRTMSQEHQLHTLQLQFVMTSEIEETCSIHGF